MSNCHPAPIDVLIYGTCNWAKLVDAELRRDCRWRVIAFACDDIYYDSDVFLDRPLYRFSEVDAVISPEQVKMLACGVYRSPRERLDIYRRGKAKGYEFTNFISPDAMVADSAELGENNFIFGGVYLDHNCRLGNSNVLRPNVYLGHDSVIGDGVYLSPGCHVAGNCRIGDLSFLGLGCNVIGQRRIGREVLVGAGSLVLRDAEDYGKYFGSPARRTGEIAPGQGIRLD